MPTFACKLVAAKLTIARWAHVFCIMFSLGVRTLCNDHHTWLQHKIIFIFFKIILIFFPKLLVWMLIHFFLINADVIFTKVFNLYARFRNSIKLSFQAFFSCLWIQRNLILLFTKDLGLTWIWNLTLLGSWRVWATLSANKIT